MKSALLLLLLVCLLVTAPMTAAACEPTNGDALVANSYVTKTLGSEEVAVAPAASENVTLCGVDMEQPGHTTVCLIGFDFLYDDRKTLTGGGREHSRVPIQIA